MQGKKQNFGKRMEINFKDHTEEYRKKLKIGQEYQDFITRDLMNHGICFTNYNSKKYQCKFGENSAGIEIKCDLKLEKTGNLYIETKEKSKAMNPYFVQSGIYRDDNTFIYIIGNYKKYWLFSKKTLIDLHKSERYKEVKIPTSQGYLLPIGDANDYCMKYHIPKESHESDLSENSPPSANLKTSNLKNC